MTGLATGFGEISSAKCAQQMALAVKHFIEASAHPKKWSSMSWGDTVPLNVEIRRTYALT